ncbi:MAG: GNAT family N-acetyltransferase [Prevotella sp.]|nr:GNAT family N-acetyltransferase [Prevotella sp.]
MNTMSESPVVTLRAMEPEDLDLLYQIENDKNLWGVGATNVPYSRYVLHDYVANSSGDIYTDKQVRLMVDCQQQTVDCQQQTIGIVDLINFSPKHCRAEVGMVLMPSYRGKGLGEMILQELAQYAKTVLHLHQLYAVIGVDNAPAIHLFEKIGYSAGRVLTDWLFDGTHYQDAVLMQRVL